MFLGIETPSAAALEETEKSQNLRMPPARAVETLTRAGLEVFAGFIVGFDSEGPDIFERQLALISGMPIPRAMVGLLLALPGTRLWRRLEAEGRLRGQSWGDNCDRPNFVPAQDERTLLAGYRRLLATLEPGSYYARCALALDQLPLRARAVADAGGALGSLATVARIAWGIGVRSPRRLHFWRLVAHALRRGADALPRALALAWSARASSRTRRTSSCRASTVRSPRSARPPAVHAVRRRCTRPTSEGGRPAGAGRG